MKLSLKISLLTLTFTSALGHALFSPTSVQAFPGQEDSFFERGNEQFEQIIEQFQSTQPEAVVVTPKFRTVPRESTLKSIGVKHHGKQAKKLQQRI
ncbi:MAG: hypothetical protein AAFV85_27610 [Cyanobacteria bacterium J06634_6]